MDSPLHGQPPVRWRQLHLFDPHPEKPSQMTLRVPKWLVPIMGSLVLGGTTWLCHLTLVLGDVQQVQARSEYLFESHDELREDVREQAKMMSEIRQSLARIEARLDQ